MPKENYRIRLNLEFSPVIHKQMLRVMKRTNSASITETLRRSLQVYDLITTVQMGGGKVQLVNSSGEAQQLVIL